MKLKVSKAAADDLEGIWLYTLEHWSPQQADRYLDLILNAFDQIAGNPKFGKDYGHVREGYLGSNVGEHLIFYRVDTAGNKVEIIRVLHARMNIEGRLKP